MYVRRKTNTYDIVRGMGTNRWNKAGDNFAKRFAGRFVAVQRNRARAQAVRSLMSAGMARDVAWIVVNMALPKISPQKQYVPRRHRRRAY